MKYRAEIDGLRAIAVLSVVIFHFFPQLLLNGYLGVDIFFIISGFLISTQLLNASTNNKFIHIIKLFYKKRIKRLFPALFFFLTITYVFFKLFFLEKDIISFENSLIASYTFWANFHFLMDGGYFGGNDKLKPLLHIWSLSVEEQFYLIFPFFLFISLGITKKINNFLITSVVLITLISFALWLILNNIDAKNLAFFILPTRIWQFGLGTLLAVILFKGLFPSISIFVNRMLFFISVSFIALSILFDLGSLLQTIMVSVGALGFIAFSRFQNYIFFVFFRSSFLIFFGKISYSLYLYHWPIAVALSYYFVDKTPLIYSFMGILISCLLGFASYKLIENIFRNKLNFKATLSFLLLCSLVSYIIFLTIPNNQTSGLAKKISKASGTNFRCEFSSYKLYGASRACIIKKDKSSNRMIVLMGNSHAQMYAPLVSSVTPNNSGLLLVPLNGCLPTTTVNISQRCILLAKKNLSSILEDKNIKTVIIGTTWYKNTYIDSKGKVVDKIKLKDAITKLVDSIRSSGKYTILFSPIAVPYKNYTSELPRKLRFNQISEKIVLDKIKISRLKYDEQFYNINSHFEKLLGNAYVKVYDDLCNQNNCFYGSQDVFYFADHTHLSKFSFKNFNKTKEQLKSLLASLE